MRQLFRFMFHHASHLTFGAMLMAMSSFGQTYFVSLYGQDFREAFGLTDGGLGGLYAIGTVMSAITLTWAGRLIDYTTTRRFTLAVTLLLLTACLLVSGAQAAWMLCIGFYFLRLGGQGLMVHTALTATARQFPLDAGKALGAIALGLSLAQAVFPVIAVQISALTGWRAAWGINAGMLVAGVGVALMFCPGKEKPLRTFRKRVRRKKRGAGMAKPQPAAGAACRWPPLYHHRLLLPPCEAGTGERLGAVVGGGMVYCLCHYPGGIAAVVWPAD
ncbi:MFS transporter [Klebsiella pneumoniae]|uniref:MFS transporter n=1 Tax=Klebsiella pneumoniae TaxID=573 RepID=UPI001D0DBE40|nr:MFS transporter [Klebsiella pneumoniae]